MSIRAWIIAGYFLKPILILTKHFLIGFHIPEVKIIWISIGKPGRSWSWSWSWINTAKKWFFFTKQLLFVITLPIVMINGPSIVWQTLFLHNILKNHNEISATEEFFFSLKFAKLHYKNLIVSSRLDWTGLDTHVGSMLCCLNEKLKTVFGFYLIFLFFRTVFLCLW